MAIEVHLICIGKLKSPFREIAEEYESRLKKRVDLRIHEFQARSKAQDEQVLDREENELVQKALEKIRRPGSVVWALSPRGKSISTEELASRWEGFRLQSRTWIFLIGGSHGLQEELLKGCDFRLAFGPMTFPHQLFRGMLLEQIYRADTILAGEPYHK